MLSALSHEMVYCTFGIRAEGGQSVFGRFFDFIGGDVMLKLQ